MKEKIKLGDKVKCKITGFIGIVVARTEFLNGCIQYNVAPKWEKQKNPMEQEISIDEQSLEVVKQKIKKKVKKERNGGATTRNFSQRGY